MLPRHAYLSATMVALAATMSEDDLDASPDLWSKPLGRAMVDDMRADEEAQDGSHYDKAHSYLGDDLDYLWQKGKQEDIERKAALAAKAERWLPKSAEHVAEQRASKKARAKRKAKKGWA